MQTYIFMKQIFSFFIFLFVFSFVLQMPGSPLAAKKAYANSDYLASAAKFSADLIAKMWMSIPLAERSFSLENRYGDKFVNDVFKDNILLALAYASGKVTSPKNIDWDLVREPFKFEFTLNPGEVFAFHDDILPEYNGKVVKTTNAHFNYQDGFKSDGYLYGDGVCHLASLINWAARDAGLKVDSRVNHNFANIPEVPREYGTSIVTTGTPSLNAQMQNLYVENTFDQPVRIVFDYKDSILTVSVYK